MNSVGLAPQAYCWGIEDSLRWVLDITFREDECRIRKDHALENKEKYQDEETQGGMGQ